MTTRPCKRPARGAALLIAMLLLTVVATLAAGMVWQQWRSVQVEIAERSRVQAGWILSGALDWARLILKTQNQSHVSLNDTWAQPLAEARLSTFLAEDKNNNVDAGPEAFLSGQISDAQARYNLRNLVQKEPAKQALELRILGQLCESAGLPTSAAATIAQGMNAAASKSTEQAPLPMSRLDDLAWLGLDARSIDALRPWVILLPEEASNTQINLNTAPREVLRAVLYGMDASSVEKLLQARQSKPFGQISDAQALLGQSSSDQLTLYSVGVASIFFEVRGRLRLEERVLEEISLVEKKPWKW